SVPAGDNRICRGTVVGCIHVVPAVSAIALPLCSHNPSVHRTDAGPCRLQAIHHRAPALDRLVDVAEVVLSRVHPQLAVPLADVTPTSGCSAQENADLG